MLNGSASRVYRFRAIAMLPLTFQVLMMGNDVSDRIHTVPYSTTHTLTSGFANCMLSMAHGMLNALQIKISRNCSQFVTCQVGLWNRFFSKSSPVAIYVQAKVPNSQGSG
jgi:hypothetical protein